MAEALMTIAEVAQLLRVDGTTVRRWIGQGSLEAIILPHTSKRQAYRVKAAVVERLLAGPSQTFPSQPSPAPSQPS